jgi:hypothetical protein
MDVDYVLRMRVGRFRPALIAAAAAGAVTCLAIAAALAGPPASRTGAGLAAGAAGQQGPGALPQSIYAPYFETYLTKSNIATVARESGARYLTLAFLQTPRRGSCTLTWNGDRKEPVRPGGRYTTQIAELRAMGGNVIPSFGGYSADEGGTEIADSCRSVQRIAQAYENVVTSYNVTRLDMDVETNSLTDKAGIARRSEAIHLAQQWAASQHRTLQIDFTLPVEPSGLGSELAVLKSAIAHGVQITAVNIMAFDYYNSKTDSDMGTEAIEALDATHAELARLFPGASPLALWRMEGITLLPGIDDFPLKTEVTYLSEAQDLLYYQQAHPFQLFSIWAIQRDNGGCPGKIDSNYCSGITQPRWAFSHLLEPFTRW